MRRIFLFLAVLYLSLTTTYASESTGAGIQEIIVPNFDQESSPCRVLYSAGSMSCNGEGCESPAPEKSSLKKIQLMLSCILTSAPTGFENPPSNARIFSIQTPSCKRHVSIIDEHLKSLGEGWECYIFVFMEMLRDNAVFSKMRRR